MSRNPLSDIAARAAAPQDAPDLTIGGPGTIPDGSEALDVAELGDDCPVIPLGFLRQKNYFLDFAGQLIELGTEFRKGELMQLFGTKMAWMDVRWPQYKKVGEKDGVPQFEPDGFSQKLAQQGLIMASSKRGLFDPKGRVRGRGAHKGKQGEIVLHCGDMVMIGGRKGTRGQLLRTAKVKSGADIGGFVYPSASPLAPPADKAANVSIATQILHILSTWNWKESASVPGPDGKALTNRQGRPISMAAYLLLCWMAAASIGGALKWRPHVWITGPSGAGKSTLQDLIRLLMGDWGIFTEDATEAGVRQLLDQDTLAVMFDEIEPDESNGDVHMKIVKLARGSSSGASSLRGSQDHQAKQFVARSCFLFSSIHHHELPAQDRNRIAVLHLAAFPPKTEPLVLSEILAEWGAQLRRRLVEQWPRFGETLLRYQKEMLHQSYTGREQDQYGTLLACGDLLFHDSRPDEFQDALNGDVDRCAALVAQLASMLTGARSEGESTTVRALRHLTSHRLPAVSGAIQEPVSVWLRRAFVEISNKPERRPAREKLESFGLRLVHLKPDHDRGNGQGGLETAYLPDAPIWLVVANATHTGTSEIFERSPFPKGQWRQPLALIHGAMTNKKSRFSGSSDAHGCVLIPLAEAIDVEDAKKEAAQLKMEI